jgi:carboxymethylenebutenolidase
MTNAELLTQDVTIAGKAVPIRAYVAQPQDGGPRPAVIVVQEWWGLNDNIRDIAGRLAREGYFALAPDLYSRQGSKVATDPETAAKLMGGLKKEQGIEDLMSTVAWLRERKQTAQSKIGVTGFCMGGSYALLLPCKTKEISAAAPFYGEIPADDALKDLACPVLYVYGENDGWITRADVDRLSAALRKFNKRGEVKIYPGCSHGFFNDTRPDVYAPTEAKDAWNRTLALFKEYLG